MIAERWHRLKALFHDAAMLSPRERAQFVAKIVRDDTSLGGELGSLLAADEESSSILERPMVRRPALLDDDGESPRDVGPYRLIRLIGRGGTSLVYLAERADDQYRRRVAVKLIRRDPSAEEIRRFHQERQILAGLDHPNIARMLDGGTTADGSPYLVMEHIEGWHIDRYCARHQLTRTERLELFLEVAGAVSYAHRHLVVHRDVKPSNVLVTADGVPKLLDFGIAKLLNPALSSTEVLSTTPSLQRMTATYASPEQIRGEPVMEASDVYALGVLLYELLTGQRPYDLESRTPQDIARIICEVDPPPPSEVSEDLGDPRAARDLDAIALKALCKEPRHRYPVVDQLAADLRRFLDHRPIQARRPELSDRLLRGLRRHRSAVLLSGLILFFATATAVQTLRLHQVTKQKEAQALTAEHERQRSDEITEMLIALFGLADPAGKGGAIPVRELLELGDRRIRAELAEHPRMQATLLETLGRAHQNLALHKRAQAQLEEALRLRREHLGPRHPEIADSLSHLSFLHFASGDYKVAEKLGQEALEMRRALFGDEHPDVASSLHDLGELLRIRGQVHEAEKLYRQGLEMRRSLLGPDHREVAESLAELGLLLTENHRAALAEPLLREALTIWRAEHGVKHPKVALGLDYLGLALRDQGKHEAAARHFREAVDMQEELLGPSHPDLAVTLTDFGRLYFEAGRFEEAEPLLRRSLAIETALYGDRHPMVGTAANDLALLLSATGEFDEAEALFLRALAVYRATLGEENPAVPAVLVNLARLYAGRRDQGVSESYYQEALALYRRRNEDGAGGAWEKRIVAIEGELENLRSGIGWSPSWPQVAIAKAVSSAPL